MPSDRKQRIRDHSTLQRFAALSRRRGVAFRTQARNLAQLLGIGRRTAYGCLGALAGFAAMSMALLLYLFPSPPSRIVIATATAGTSFEQFARRYAEILARSGVVAEVRQTAGPQENIELLRHPTWGVDAAFVTEGVERAQGGRQVWSLGALFQSQLWIFYRSSVT